MPSTEHSNTPLLTWAVVTIITISLLFFVVLYDAIDDGYEGYETFQVFIVVQIIEVAGSLSIYRYAKKHNADPRKMEYLSPLFGFSEMLCYIAIFFGIIAVVLLGQELKDCLSLTSQQKEQAEDCISRFNGVGADPSIATTGCVLLQGGVASKVNGLCPNVRLGDDNGNALMIVQFICIILLMICNIAKLFTIERLLDPKKGEYDFSDSTEKTGSLISVHVERANVRSAYSKPTRRRTPARVPARFPPQANS